MKSEILTTDKAKELQQKTLNSQKINIGIIGAGRFGIHHLNAFRQMEKTSSLKLITLSDINTDVCHKYGRQFEINAYQDYRKMIESEDLTAVSIATPDHLHGDVIKYALENDLYVFVEKPLEICPNKAKEVVDLAQNKNLLLQVDFHKRYDPYHIEIKELIRQNKIGDFLYGYCYMEDKITVPRVWFPHWADETSPAWFLGTNFIDLMDWLLPYNAENVFATGQKGKLSSIGIDTYDSIQAMITYQNKSTISYNFSWILPEQFPSIVNQGFRLIGSEGIVESDSQERGTITCFASEPGMNVHNSGFIYKTENPDGTYQYRGYGITSIQHFVKNVLYLKNGGDLDNLCGSYPSGKDALKVTNIVHAIHRSLDSGEPVCILNEKGQTQVREKKYA
ncbi:MAG: Gfo/Idh/MocA family oxidoreductase [Calditrichae bacterium]|nr:Gfo/Idh/MocA family oxidoreductase [Calditrichia bacterium]